MTGIDISQLIELMEAGRPFCAAVVVASDRPELPPGSRAAVTAGGTVEGGWPAALKAQLRAAALAALADGESRTAELSPGVRVFLDAVSPAAALLICGAGHIALPLARFARETGFSVTVLDDRPEFASPARFPGCAVIAGDFREQLRALPLGPSVYAVVITRGHEHDTECLEEILPKSTAYVGLIGSRRRVGFVLATLGREKGIPKKRLADVFTPIGVPTGGSSPEEIALAIAAELVCVRRRGAAAARALRSAR